MQDSGETSVKVMKIKQLLHLPPAGDHQARWAGVQGGEAARNPHPHGDVRWLPEENGADHRRLHTEPAQTRPDWLRSSGRGGLLVVTGNQYDVQPWICWVKVHCSLTCAYWRGSTASGTNTSVCYRFSAVIINWWTERKKFYPLFPLNLNTPL